MNRYDTNASFVMADQAPTVATPETSLLRRQDVVEASTAVIRAYSEQQNALLGRLQACGITSQSLTHRPPCLLRTRR